MKRSTSPWVRRFVTLVVGAAIGILTLAAPAGAQQLVDAGKEGDGSGGLDVLHHRVLAALHGPHSPARG
jgi:hypothetical protein